MTAPPSDRLRSAFKRRRAELGYRTDAAFASAAGIPYRTLVNLLAGKPTRVEDAVEIHLGWAQGSVAAARGGGEPTVTEMNPRPAPETKRPDVRPPGQSAEPYLTRRTGPDLTDVTTDALLEELAKRARANNPDAQR